MDSRYKAEYREIEAKMTKIAKHLWLPNIFKERKRTVQNKFKVLDRFRIDDVRTI